MNPVTLLNLAIMAGLSVGLPLAAPVLAQPSDPAAPTAESKRTVPTGPIDFEADLLTYDDRAGVVTATGNVVVVRDGYRLRADQVSWNRGSGLVTARGKVEVTDPAGGRLLADSIDLTDTLRDGAVENLRLFLEDGARLAAAAGQRVGPRIEARRAVYSPCEVCTPDGREQPTWRLKAAKVVRDEETRRIYYQDATLEILNVPVAYLPFLSHPDPSVDRASGFLVPELRQTRRIGLSASAAYHWALKPWRDLTLEPTIYTEAKPVLGFEYRERFRPGPLRFGGSVTYTDAQTGLLPEPSKDRLRGHIDADLRLDHSGGWRSTARLNVTTDDTYLRRYDFSTEDALRSTYALEHFGRRSYFSARLWGFQGLRANDRQGLTPLVLPVIEYDYTSDPMWLGGRLSLAANGAGIIRTGGMDSQRLIGIARYDVPYLNRLGMKFLATAQVRGDLYNANDNARPDDPVYAGRDGTTGRFLPLAALEVRWPLGATGFGGFQTLEPIVQFITTSTAAKSALIPNEDSRSIDLDETNLFSLNRFTGYDRYEGGTRMAYGGRYTLDRGALGVDIQIGQSYRLDRQSVAFPSGTGLSGRFSDIVGRTTVSLGSRVDIIHRFRVDKSTLAVRRNEIDTVLSGARWQLAVGYTNLDRNIGIEDLEDLEEVRVSGRVKIARRWTLSASTIQDLTSGFDPIRYTAGLEYEDECFVFGLTWRRNLTEDRDFRKGSTFVLRIALRTLGTTQ